MERLQRKFDRGDAFAPGWNAQAIKFTKLENLGERCDSLSGGPRDDGKIDRGARL